MASGTTPSVSPAATRRPAPAADAPSAEFDFDDDDDGPTARPAAKLNRSGSSQLSQEGREAAARARSALAVSGLPAAR